MPRLKCMRHPPSTNTTHRRTQCQQFNGTQPSPNSMFPGMARSVFPSSLFSSATLYDDLEEQTAAAQSVTAAVLSLSEYSETDFIRGRTRESRTVYRRSCTWFQDYLATHPVYPSPRFREVFRIPKSLYHILHDELLEEEPALQQKTDAFRHLGHTSHQKILMTLRRLATGLPYRQIDDMARKSVESPRQAYMLTLKKRHRHFGPMYLNRMPTECELRATTKQYVAC